MAFEHATAEALYPLAIKDTAKNYFVCYSINNHQTYAAVWQLKEDDKPIIGVFLRKTGIVQIIQEPGIIIENYKDDLATLLGITPWKQAFVTTPLKMLIQGMQVESRVHEGAYIAACTPEQYRPRNLLYEKSTKKEQSNIDMAVNGLTIKELTVDDLDDVIAIYLEVFKGFASYDYMVEKLKSGRGRAIGGYVDGKLVTVAQSDYERSDSAIIVGVATRIAAQGKGYGRICFEHLCNQLILKDRKTLYLQYDAPVAGALYKSLGFEIVEQIFHVEKIEEVNR
jgi:ribosomal protein S18 acetylase RimI-like enzyme